MIWKAPYLFLAKAASVKTCLEAPSKTLIAEEAMSYAPLAAKRKKVSPDRKSIQSRSDGSSAHHQVKSVPRSISFILILCLILQGPASWFTSSPLGKRAWDFFSYQPLSAQQLIPQPPEQHQTKTNLPYDVALVRLMGGYGPMPGSDVNHNLEPEWRGHYLDWTGFYYMGARYYDPNSGRFLSADPLGHSASMDLYSYCNGDPVNGLDPDGRCVEKGKEEFSEGYDKSYYADGADVKYDNGVQQFGGFVGKSILQAEPVIGTDPGTLAIGGQFNVAVGLQFNVSLQGSISNWADPAARRIGGIISITPLTGVSTAIGVSAGFLTTKSSINVPEKLNGWSGSAGSSVSVGGFVGGYDAGNWGKNPTYNFFNGVGITPTLGMPFIPVEVHTAANWSKGWSWNF